MKNYTIITTYPAHGSKNIGDALITKSLIEAIKSIKREEIKFNIIWRESEWKDIKDSILNSNLVIFACLALRPKMHKIEYPSLEEIVNSNVPLAVISAGTHFPSNSSRNNYFDSFSKETLKVIKKINDNAICFTTRGFLTQGFCNYHNLDRAEFSGDIAFYDQRFDHLKFNKKNFKDVKKIVISDPHNPHLFLPLFNKLVFDCRKTFPNVEITCFLHGKNDVIKKNCEENNILFKEIYLDKESGLDEYDNFDLHVGFRVHGHVSALKRRVISYLIEQDGRGCDYGLTISRKITVPSRIINLEVEKPNYENNSLVGAKAKLKLKVKKILLNKLRVPKPKKTITVINQNAANEVISLIMNDGSSSFQKFVGLEDEIRSFNENSLKVLNDF